MIGLHSSKSLVNPLVHLVLTIASNCSGHGLEQLLGLDSLAVAEAWHLLQTLLQTCLLALFIAEGFEDLLLVLCLHLRVVKGRVKLGV